MHHVGRKWKTARLVWLCLDVASEVISPWPVARHDPSAVREEEEEEEACCKLNVGVG